MNYELIAEQVKQYVSSYFDTNSKEQLIYHDKSHTESVVSAAEQIANHYHLDEHDLFVVKVAAWFHDMGYCMAGTATMHEQKSAGLADIFLKEKGVYEETVTAVKNCILATRMPQNPVTLQEQIVCDADLFHLGTDAFSRHNKQMRKEYEATKNIQTSKGEWRKETVQFLLSHEYHTDYCKDLLNKKKQENLEKLLQKENDELTQQESSATVKEQPSGKKKKVPSRGIETMFRIAVTNHQRLSSMADKKANIMISVNSIIISVVIGLVMRKLETTPALIIPTMILLTGCVIAVIFSVLSTRPKIPDGYFSPEQLSNKKVNLLFFGNFYNMDYEHYNKGMRQVMEDGKFLYATLIRDIHSQGKVLGRKYKLLRISYTIFMYTLIITIFAFSIAFIII